MIEKDHISSVKRRFEQRLQLHLRTFATQRVKPSFAACSEVLEGSMERPGIDTKPFPYHIKDGKVVAGRESTCP